MCGVNVGIDWKPHVKHRSTYYGDSSVTDKDRQRSTVATNINRMADAHTQ